MHPRRRRQGPQAGGTGPRSGRWSTDLLEFTQFSLQLFRDVVLANPTYLDIIANGPYTLDVQNMGLVDEHDAPDFYDGQVRVVDFEGKELHRYEAKDYADYVAEHVEPWTYLKFPYLKQRGWKGFREGIDSSIYCATPLARLNVAERMATPRAQEAFEEMFSTLGGHPSRLLLAQHWARLVEMVQNAETLQQYCDDPEITGDQFRVIPQRVTGEGVGIVEAMRGTLDPPLHLRRERHLHQRQPHRRHDQQQRAHPDGHQEGRRDAHPARDRSRPGHPQHDRDGVPGLRPLLQLRDAQHAGADAAPGARAPRRRGDA